MAYNQSLDIEVEIEIFKRKLPTHAECEAEAKRVWAENPRCCHFLKGFDAFGGEIGEFNFLRYAIPEYSRDIAAAWRVIDEINRRTFSVRQKFVTCLRDECSKQLAGYPRYTLHVSEIPLAMTPERICRAALRAIVCGPEPEDSPR